MRKAVFLDRDGTLLFERAIRELQLDTTTCAAVGDRLSDLVPAQLLGVRTVFVLTGYGPVEMEKARADGFEADHLATDLLDAARWIVQISPSSPSSPTSPAQARADSKFR